MRLPFHLLGLVMLAAAPALAQTAAPAQKPTAPAAPLRFYVGLGAYHSNYQNLASWRQGDTGFRVPVQLTAGYQLRPRLALELGVAYSGRGTSYATDGYYYYTSSAPTYFQYAASSTRRMASVSALARYNLTRQAAHRLQADALGGFTLVHETVASHSVAGDSIVGSFQVVPSDFRRAYNTLLLTAGLGLRYRLSPRFALNFDLATNRNLGHPNAYQGFTGSAALGLRYRFGG
ncbi:MAG: outer membrane beta-barrel protein [Bacteroidota bacterium]|nr:outer membrane beta-barrel protein [Bacteroidota bacterium]